MNFARAAVLIFVLVTICSITSLLAQDLTPKEFVEAQPVLALPGQLSAVPLFNSNNPEVVQSEGILLSTLSPQGKASPQAHLNYTFDGDFGIFSHHIARPFDDKDKRTLYQGLILFNPGDQDAKVEVRSGASYLSQPDSPFKDLPAFLPNPHGKVHAGPGGRVADDVLRGRKPKSRLIKHTLTIKPGEAAVIARLPIPVGKFIPPLNGRSTLIHLRLRSGKVQAADVAVYGKFDSKGKEIKPADEEFIAVLNNGGLAGPREKPASAPGAAGAFAYGRVAGVSQGTYWNCTSPQTYPIALPGEQFSFVVSALERGGFGSGQDQAAPLVVRYPESAYRAHGNYGVFYDLALTLENRQPEARDVEVIFQTPLKADTKDAGLQFASPPYKQVFFRGTVRVSYPDARGKLQSKHFHLVQHRGEQGQPLATVHILPGESRTVVLQFIYPPDATPPQVITIRTLR